MPKKPIQYKYDELLSYLNSAIDEGILAPGGKLPSLRKLSKQFNCALSVAMQAYHLLEMQGRIHSIEKSGFFVSVQSKEALPELKRKGFPLMPIKPKVPDSLSRMVELSTDPDLVPLGAGVPHPSILPLPALALQLARAAKTTPALLSTYAAGQGHPGLRQALADYLFEKGICAQADDILITQGCVGALAVALRTLTNEGDVVAIENPMYFMLIALLRQLKRKIIEIPANAQTGIDLDALDKAARKHKIKVCLVSASFQNPLGFVMPDENKERLVSQAAHYGFTIIEDDIYGDTGFTHKRFLPVRHYAQGEEVVYCSSFSKTIAPGLRLGWLLPGKSRMQTCDALAFAESLGCSNILQKSLADFMAGSRHEFHLKLLRKRLAEQNHHIRRAVLEYFPEETRVTQPQGGYFLWVELPKAVSANRLFEDGLKQGVCIIPGPLFTTTQRYQNYIRLSCSSPVTGKTLAGIKRLGQAAKILSRQR